MNRRPKREAHTTVAVLIVAVVGFYAAFVATPASALPSDEPTQETAQDSTETTDTADDHGDDGAADAEVDDMLREGAAVYSQICSACHQPGGVGLETAFPPLTDNPNIDEPAEADYIRDVIDNGLDGEITVAGITYDGVMPSFSTLSDEDVEAVVFYIQSDFQAPSSPEPEVSSGPVAGSELPPLADVTWITAYLIAALIALLVVAPRLASRNDRLDTPWLDVWLKAAAMFIAIVLAIAFIPNWVLQNSAVTGLSRPVQDLIGVSVWGLGLALCLGAIWYAHRDSRI